MCGPNPPSALERLREASHDIHSVTLYIYAKLVVLYEEQTNAFSLKINPTQTLFGSGFDFISPVLDSAIRICFCISKCVICQK